jgi:hypothetical protein
LLGLRVTGNNGCPDLNAGGAHRNDLDMYMHVCDVLIRRYRRDTFRRGVVKMLNVLSGSFAYFKGAGVVLMAKCLLLASTISLIMAWFLAFFNGYHVIISINNHNEAYPELIMWIVGIPCIVVWTYSEWEAFKKDVYAFRRRYQKKYHTLGMETL